jgi:hypothetical protein
MNINYKKTLKFVTLLISALLIATASATIYDYMYLDANVGVQGMALAWTLGADNETAGTQINGVTASLTELKGPPNGTRTYADPVRLNNTGASSVTFDLLVDTVGGDTGELDSIYVRIYSLNTSAWINNVTVWESGAKGSDATGLPIPADNMWRFQWEIKWKSTATIAHSATVNLKIKVPVA